MGCLLALAFCTGGAMGASGTAKAKSTPVGSDFQAVALAMPDATHGLLAYFVKSSVVVAEVTPPGNIRTVAAGHFTALTGAAYRSIAINSAGAAVAVWGVSRTGAVMAAYRPAGAAWSAPAVLAPSGNSPVVKAAITASGEAAVVWANGGDRKPASLTAALSTGDGTWTTTPKLPTSEWVTEPMLAFNSDGASIVFGGETRFREVVVSAARVADGTSLGSVSLDTNGCNQGQAGPIGLAPSPDGTMLATWCRAAAGASIVVADLSVAGDSLKATPPKRLGTVQRSRIPYADSFATADLGGTVYVTWQAVTGPNLYVATRKAGKWKTRHQKLSGVIAPLSGVIAPAESGALLGFQVYPDPEAKVAPFSVATLAIGESGALPPLRTAFKRVMKGLLAKVYSMRISAVAESNGRVLVIRAEAGVKRIKGGAEGTGFRLVASFSGA